MDHEPKPRPARPRPDLAAAVRHALQLHEAAGPPGEGPGDSERGLHFPKVDPARIHAGLAKVDQFAGQVMPILDGLAPAQVKAVADLIAAVIHAAASAGGTPGNATTAL